MEALVTTLLGACLLGHLVDRALLGDPGCGPVERICRGLALGIGSVGLISMLCDAFGLGVSRTSLGAAVGLVALLLLALTLRGTTPRQARPEVGGVARLDGVGRVVWVLLLLLAVVGLAVAVRSGWIRQTFQFDAIVRWMFKAKVLAHEGTLLGPLSTDPQFGMTHQRYPPLVSHVANVPSLILGRYDDRIGSAVFAWYAVALTGLVYGALARRVGLVTAALGAAWVAHLPIVSFVVAPPPGAGAASAMADVPLSLFVTGALLAAADAVDGVRDRAHLEAGLMLGFATLTKNEALPLVVVMALVMAISAPRARVRRALGVAGLGAAMFVVGWGWVAARLPAVDENYLAQLSVATFLSGFDRLTIIVPRLAKQFIDLRTWNVTWLAVAALMGASLGAIWRRPGLRLLALAVLLQVGSYVVAYMITAWSSPAAQEIAAQTGRDDTLHTLMRLTLDRLLMHVAPTAIVLGLMASPLTLRRAG